MKNSKWSKDCTSYKLCAVQIIAVMIKEGHSVISSACVHKG